MNNNIILLSYLLNIDKKSKLLNFDNYYWKLICILDFGDLDINYLKSKIFCNNYKMCYTLRKIRKELKFKNDNYKILLLNIIK
jgi:hypothetical protein